MSEVQVYSFGDRAPVVIQPALPLDLPRKFYTYRQNNSGGSFDYDVTRGIGVVVIVEAYSVNDANERAERIGLYFDGSGDCSCCGNRWDEQWTFRSGEDPGTFEPELYGERIRPLRDDEQARDFHLRLGGGQWRVFIHLINGEIQAYS